MKHPGYDLQFEQPAILRAAQTIDFRQITDPFAMHARAVFCNQIGLTTLDVAAVAALLKPDDVLVVKGSKKMFYVHNVVGKILHILERK